MKSITVHYDQKPIYNIVISESFDSLPEEINKLNIKDRRVCIISEDNVAMHYLPVISKIFEGNCAQLETFVFPEGEKSKNLNTVNQIYQKLIESKFDRSDILVALGGGVVGDTTGYVAATYLRGIDFIQIPTSLLAQVDSSIGGKTGVDFDSYKNMVGAFHQPKLVYVNVATLLTLSDRQFNSGLGEIIKHGLIKDASYFQWIMENKAGIMVRNNEILLEMIEKSCNIKRMVVENDPKEKGERALLNFGHTFGHAIEKLMNFELLHGECVAIGCILASHLSQKKGYLNNIDIQQIEELFHFFNFPAFPKQLDVDAIIDVTKSDKKMEAGIIKFVLLKNIGEAFITKELTDEDLKSIFYSKP